MNKGHQLTGYAEIAVNGPVAGLPKGPSDVVEEIDAGKEGVAVTCCGSDVAPGLELVCVRCSIGGGIGVELNYFAADWRSSGPATMSSVCSLAAASTCRHDGAV